MVWSALLRPDAIRLFRPLIRQQPEWLDENHSATMLWISPNSRAGLERHLRSVQDRHWRWTLPEAVLCTHSPAGIHDWDRLMSLISAWRAWGIPVYHNMQDTVLP